MALVEYSAFTKSPELMMPHHQFFSVISRALIGSLPLCQGGVAVFYSPHPAGWAIGGQTKNHWSYLFVYVLPPPPTTTNSSQAGCDSGSIVKRSLTGFSETICSTKIREHSVRHYLPIARGRTVGFSRGVMVIVIGNGHGDTSSNPGRD